MTAAKIIVHSTQLDHTHFQPASIKSRFIAVSVDGFLCQLLSPLLLFFFQQIDSDLVSMKHPLLYVSSIIFASFSSYFFVIFIPLAYSGQSPGKKLMNLKLISTTKKVEPNLLQIFSREFIYKFFSIMLFGIGFFMAVWTKRKHSLHDKLSRTEVVSL